MTSSLLTRGSTVLVSLIILPIFLHFSLGLDVYHKELRRTNLRSSFQNGAELQPSYWQLEAVLALQQRLAERERRGRARNIVLFLGDGMSVPTLTAARTLLGQRNNRTGEESRLSFETFPTVGLAKTYCVDAQVADSACTATAYFCGLKANVGTLGVTAAVSPRDCVAAVDTAYHVQSIATWALDDGRDAGVVTTTRVTHASPAGAYAHSAHRDWESDADVNAACADLPLADRPSDIALQLINSFPGNQFKVILGGGRREFLPEDTVDQEGTQGKRQDGRNLIEEWKTNKESRGVSYDYVWNRAQLRNLTSSPPEYLLGLFEGSHMQYNLQSNVETEPTLAELTETAIRSLSRNERGFFLFVEGGRIDHAHHDSHPRLALDETLELHRAVERATQLLDPEDSLIVVTADHAHVMAFNGYSSRGNDVLGPSDDVDSGGVPYMTLSYTNGPGARPHRNDGLRPDVTAETNPDYRSTGWLSHADVPLEDETHGGDDVAVFAWGAQHGVFTGLYEQSQLPHLAAYASCLTPQGVPSACSDAPQQ